MTACESQRRCFAAFGHDGPNCGSVIDETRGRGGVATGEKAFVPTAMVCEFVGDGADDGEAIGTAGVEGQQFADVEATDTGADGPEDAAVFFRGIRLHVVHFHMGRATGQPDEDHGRVGGGSGRLCSLSADLQEVTEPQHTQPEGSGFKKTAPGDVGGQAEILKFRAVAVNQESAAGLPKCWKELVPVILRNSESTGAILCGISPRTCDTHLD